MEDLSHISFFFLSKRKFFLNDKCVCMNMCVCVCVCVCVCLYSSTVKAFSICKMSETYLRGRNQQSCVVNINLGASAKFLISISKNVLLHIQRRKFQWARTGEKTIWYTGPVKRWYTDIGCKSATSSNDTKDTKRY